MTAMVHSTGDVTMLLRAWRAGDEQALNRLTPLVYDHLRRLAASYVVKEHGERQLNATALVHEAYIKLLDAKRVDWQDRGHFYAIAARTMRRLLVDAARVRTAAKRGHGAEPVAQSPVALDEHVAPGTDRSPEICSIDDALSALAAVDPVRAQVVELRFFGGLTVEETGQVVGVSPQTVMRYWKTARAWLAREMRPPSTC